MNLVLYSRIKVRRSCLGAWMVVWWYGINLRVMSLVCWIIVKVSVLYAHTCTISNVCHTDDVIQAVAVSANLFRDLTWYLIYFIQVFDRKSSSDCTLITGTKQGLLNWWSQPSPPDPKSALFIPFHNNTALLLILIIFRRSD